MMKEIKAIIQPFMLSKVCEELGRIDGLPGLTVSSVLGWGKTRGVGATDAVHEAGHTFARKAKVELVVPARLAEEVVEAISRAARTGNVGDGKIFVYELSDAVKIRTGEHGEAAI
jgi:nitrogen regulatory protein PII